MDRELGVVLVTILEKDRKTWGAVDAVNLSMLGYCLLPHVSCVLVVSQMRTMLPESCPNPANLWLVYCPPPMNPRNHPNTQTLVRIDLAPVFMKWMMTELEGDQPLSSLSQIIW